MQRDVPGVVRNVFENGSFAVQFGRAEDMVDESQEDEDVDGSEMYGEEVDDESGESGGEGEGEVETAPKRRRRRGARPGGPGRPAPGLHRYRAGELNDRIALSYALTVHKAQGSEYPIVVLPLVAGNGMSFLQRTLVYTAMSRAKHLLVVVSSPPVLEHAISNTAVQRRLTYLGTRVAKRLEGGR
jgi:hypothetical protein